MFPKKPRKIRGFFLQLNNLIFFCSQSYFLGMISAVLPVRYRMSVSKMVVMRMVSLSQCAVWHYRLCIYRISAGNVLPAVRATAAGSRYKAHSTA